MIGEYACASFEYFPNVENKHLSTRSPSCDEKCAKAKNADVFAEDTRLTLVNDERNDLKLYSRSEAPSQTGNDGLYVNDRYPFPPNCTEPKSIYTIYIY